MDNLEEMGEILRKVQSPKTEPGRNRNMNRPITSTETESVIKKLPKKKHPGPDGFTGEFYPLFRVKLTSILLKLFQKIAKEGTLSNSFYEVTITLIPKPDKDTTHTKKKNYRPISLINIDAKILNKILANQIQQYIKRIIHRESSESYSKDARIFQYLQINQCDIPH